MIRSTLEYRIHYGQLYEIAYIYITKRENQCCALGSSELHMGVKNTRLVFYIIATNATLQKYIRKIIWYYEKRREKNVGEGKLWKD